MTQEGQAEACHANQSKYDWILYEPSVLRCAVGWHSFLQTCPTSEATFAARNLASSPATPVPHPSSIPRSGLLRWSVLTVASSSQWAQPTTNSTALLFSPFCTLRSERESMDLGRRKPELWMSCHHAIYIHLYLLLKISQNTMQYAVYCDVSLKPLDTFSVSACISLLLNHSTSC